MSENIVHIQLPNNFIFAFVGSARLRQNCWTRLTLPSWVPVVDLSENKYTPDIGVKIPTTNSNYINRHSKIFLFLWIFWSVIFCVFLFYFVNIDLHFPGIYFFPGDKITSRIFEYRRVVIYWILKLKDILKIVLSRNKCFIFCESMLISKGGQNLLFSKLLPK